MHQRQAVLPPAGNVVCVADEKKYRSIDTALVHAGAPIPRVERAVATPIFQSATYMASDEAAYDELRYVRLNNTINHHVLHAKLATIESAEAALVTASGMAAITTALLANLRSGDHLLAQNCLYGGTHTFLQKNAPSYGISHTVIDVSNPAGWEAMLKPSTKVIYVEAITNPTMQVGDLKAVVSFARHHSLVSIIDATFATPINFRASEIGFDLVVHSATKYLNGHSDIGAGAIMGRASLVAHCRSLLNHLGGMLDPHACFLLERGLKTLALRVRKQNENALQLAQALSSMSHVTKVNYPGLPTDRSHNIAASLFSGFGGMLSFEIDTPVRVASFFERLTIPLHAWSLGGVETLVVLPAKSSHVGLSQSERDRLGISDRLVRVSVGIEDAPELIDDFRAALA